MPPSSDVLLDLIVDAIRRVRSIRQDSPIVWLVIPVLAWLFDAQGLFSNLLSVMENKRQARAARTLLAHIYTADDIDRYTRHYVKQHYLQHAPTHYDEPRDARQGVKGELFEYVDRFVTSKQPDAKFLMILADSGTGKSSFCINYVVKRSRRPRPGCKWILDSLGDPKCLDRVQGVAEPENAILVLDGLDEDPAALGRFLERWAEIERATIRFRRVVVTCRLQFITTGSQLPHRSIVVRRAGPQALDDDRRFSVDHVYISPLRDRQIKQFIDMSVPFWRRRERSGAMRLVKAIPLLSVRPMLLGYLPHLAKQDPDRKWSTTELYRECIEQWLAREVDADDAESAERKRRQLLELSMQIAVSMCVPSHGLSYRAVDIATTPADGGTPIPTDADAAGGQRAAHALEMPLRDVGRSLLVPASGGGFKFAHRSFAEYFVVEAALSGERRAWGQMSDMMRLFLSERLEAYWPELSRGVRLQGTAWTLGGVADNAKLDIVVPEDARYVLLSRLLECADALGRAHEQYYSSIRFAWGDEKVRGTADNAVQGGAVSISGRAIGSDWYRFEEEASPRNGNEPTFWVDVLPPRCEYGSGTFQVGWNSAGRVRRAMLYESEVELLVSGSQKTAKREVVRWRRVGVAELLCSNALVFGALRERTAAGMASFEAGTLRFKVRGTGQAVVMKGATCEGMVWDPSSGSYEIQLSDPSHAE